MKRVVKDKKGEGYIDIAVTVIIFCMILSVLIYFVSVNVMVKEARENIKNAFDSYITKNSIIIFESIKQGNDKNEGTLDSSPYISEINKNCTFDNSGSTMYTYDTSGELRYYMDIPGITFTVNKSLKLRLDTHIYVPIYFNGQQVATANIPITITSSLAEKF